MGARLTQTWTLTRTRTLPAWMNQMSQRRPRLLYQGQHPAEQAYSAHLLALFSFVTTRTVDLDRRWSCWLGTPQRIAHDGDDPLPTVYLPPRVCVYRVC